MLAREVKKYKCVGITAAVIGLIVVVAFCIFFVLFIGNSTKVMGATLIIDHDGGADDAMAIFIALLNEKFFDGPSVVGLTTVNGNVNENQVYINTQRILDVAKRRDVPIFRGSVSAIVIDEPSDAYFGVDGLGDLENVSYIGTKPQPQHAVNALIELSKEHEGNLTVVAIGALTNIALAMKLDPNFIYRLNQLYVAAGTVYGDEFPNPEFNALMDVEAYEIVVKNSVPEKVTIIPFSQIMTSISEITREWRQNVLGSINTDIMKAQNEFERISIQKKGKWHMLDPAAMAIVLNKDIVIGTRYSDNAIILCGDERGINTNNFTDFNNSNVNAIYSVNDTLYQSFLLDVFSAELRV